jgi:hypothetical protein
MPNGWWWRGAGVALGYVVFSVLVGLGQHTATFQPDYWGRLGLVAVSGLLAGFGVGPLAARLRLPTAKRLAVLFVIVFALLSLSNAVEVALYLPAATVIGTVVGGIVQSLVLALLIGLLWRPAGTDGQLRLRRVWSWRVLVLAVLWVPVYLAFVALDSPVVEAIERANGVRTFDSPPLTEIIGPELVRGLLHAVVFAIIAVLVARPWPWCALALALLNGWIPILPQTSLPALIRIANGVEITLSAVVFALVAALLLSRSARSWHAV